jgi:hypothetical protein
MADTGVVSRGSNSVGSYSPVTSPFQPPSGTVVVGEKRLDLPADVGVIRTGPVQIGAPRGRVRPFKGFEKDIQQTWVVFGHWFDSHGRFSLRERIC